MAGVGECLRAVGLQFWAGSLRVLPALLAPAVLLGLLLGAAAAALLCRCAMGPRRRREVRGGREGKGGTRGAREQQGEGLQETLGRAPQCCWPGPTREASLGPGPASDWRRINSGSAVGGWGNSRHPSLKWFYCLLY